MTTPIAFMIDGVRVQAEPGQTIIEAADAAGVYIPRLCHKPGLEPWGGCRLCTVMVNGRTVSACTQPAVDGAFVENDTDEILAFRRSLVEMLFVSGNHFCMSCERSGNCELQGMAYRLGIAAPTLPYMNPQKDLDASHPDIMIDHNRCILCARCVRTSRDVDGKHVFDFVGRGAAKSLAINSEAWLRDTDLDTTDEALDACPVGALLRKGTAFGVPVGQRAYDHEPIGSDIEHSVTTGPGDEPQT